MNIPAIIPLPCGCLVDSSYELAFAASHYECPWCWATFPARRMHEWFMEHHEHILGEVLARGRVAPRLAWSGERLVEIVGHCGHGAVAREYRGKGEEFHLTGPVRVAVE